MKKIIGALCAVGITASILSFNTNEIADFQGTNTPDLQLSHISWKGSKYDAAKGADKFHLGQVGLKDAKIKMKNDTPESLSITVDLNKIDNYDLADGVKGQLISHLKSADFFNVGLFPDAKFTSTKIEKLVNDKADFKMTGNITIKGVSKPIEVKGHIVKDHGKNLLESDVFYLNGEEFGFIKPGGGYHDVEFRVQLYMD